MKWLAAAALAALIASGPAPPGAAFGAEMLTFVSLDGDQKFALSGALVMPERAPGRAPAVVIVHATGGVDGTGAFYRGALNAAGVATFEVDFETGLFASSTDHGFDRPGNAVSYPDPRAADGRGHIGFNAKAAEDARVKVTAFFGTWLAMGK